MYPGRERSPKTRSWQRVVERRNIGASIEGRCWQIVTEVRWYNSRPVLVSRGVIDWIVIVVGVTWVVRIVIVVAWKVVIVFRRWCVVPRSDHGNRLRNAWGAVSIPWFHTDGSVSWSFDVVFRRYCHYSRYRHTASWTCIVSRGCLYSVQMP